jgi:hypothetical protein
VAIVFLFVEAYFLIDFLTGNTQIQSLADTLVEFNYTAIAEGYYSAVLNGELLEAL